MAADPCRASRPELAALALGRLDAGEQVALLAHLDGCAACRELLTELRDSVAALGHASLAHLDTDHVPAADLLDRITTQASIERASRRRHRRRRLTRAVLGAAAAVAFALVGFLVVARDGTDAPRLQPFAVAPAGADVRFGLAPNEQGTEIVLQQRGLDPNGVYWMWITDQRGERFTAGTFRGAPRDHRIRMQSALAMNEAVRVWCTDGNQDVVLDSWVQR